MFEDSPHLEVSVVMPCLNEAETLRSCVEEALGAIRETGCTGEVVIADNGSTDGSQAIAEKAGARVVNVLNKGYGNALIGGIQAARGRYVLMGDADGSYDFRELPKFLACLRGGDELVMGCRFPRGGGRIEPGAMPWKHRWLGNPVLSGLGRIFFSAPVQDFHCGLRAFSRDAILRLDLQCAGMEFASEMVVKSVVARLRMAQVPITLRPDGRSRPPHLRSWRDGWRHLRFMLLFSPKWLFFIPGILLFLVGLAGMLLLLGGPVTIGDVSFDTNTLLVSATMMLVGFQTLFFAVFIKAYAVHAGFLRPDPRIQKLLKAGPAEWGALLGLAALLFGLGYIAYAYLGWRETGFGPLPYSDSLRIVLPGVTLIALGVQTLFSGFAFAILGLERRTNGQNGLQGGRTGE